jgi:hypothetical protein
MVEPVALFARLQPGDTSNIAEFPVRSRAMRPGGYTIADVARPLGLLDFAIRTIIEKLRLLAEHDGMPLPRTPRIVDGRPMRGPRAIHYHSRWDAGEFDAWLYGRHPGAPASSELPVPGALRDEMQRRARSIAGAR